MENMTCRHCEDAHLELDNMIGPWKGFRCPACNHYHAVIDGKLVIFHDNHCGCDEKGTETFEAGA